VRGNEAAKEAAMERKYEVGQHVVFVDPYGKRRDALITIWWGLDHYKAAGGEPGCNLIVVSDDEKKDDSYGRQTEHFTSVVHKTKQPAHGNYWCWSDE
jgi:hypothetical protein